MPAPKRANWRFVARPLLAQQGMEARRPFPVPLAVIFFLLALVSLLVSVPAFPATDAVAPIDVHAAR